jgi:hypothetical protein
MAIEANESMFLELASQVVRWLACEFPVFLVWAAGIIIAISRWRRHPRVSMLVVGGLALHLAANVLHVCASVLIPYVLASGDRDHIMVAYSVIQIVFAGLYAVAWGMILLAVFGWRNFDPYSANRWVSSPPSSAPPRT